MITLKELRSWNTDEETAILLDYLEEHGFTGSEEINFIHFYVLISHEYCGCDSCFPAVLKYMRGQYEGEDIDLPWGKDTPSRFSRLIKLWVESKFKELCRVASK